MLGDLTYEYDKNGNRITTGGSFARTGIPDAVGTTAYNAANQQTTFADKTLTYDNNGNLQTISDPSGTTTYTWNARNQLVGISGPGVSATFVYDGLGRRESKTINGNLTEFLYDRLNPVQETSGATILANILPGLGTDEFLTRTDVVAGVTSNFLTDALGSPVAVTDSAGTVQTEYTYEPFGKTTFTGSSNSSAYQYTGRENDRTGLFYYRARYYHPELQRFISEDPISFQGGINFYTYISDNPINYVDPLGLYPFNPNPEDYAFQFAAGTDDMLRNYKRMRERIWQGADKWYHCMANCQATNRGPGGAAAAQIISFFRTNVQSWFTEPDDWRNDDKANKCGQQGGDCEKTCGPYVPQSSPGKPPFPGW